ncbi:type I-MYXAN CRISPR-associated protein Cas6/Cmx6 [Pseudanabaena sp. PCC 6802]|uniref:type I-MYXAN CRISPR-associated protein Cas6/Cmx6 n=1 Tax=Pseudanabaena sp. PCC 6802 TaxID=118173 RepID=UPI00034854B0|nr:type I-MYXAN CRISPR-associated protein Cas6/Cmx6 [Pseudanabaena sp. PCC 6802]
MTSSFQMAHQIPKDEWLEPFIDLSFPLRGKYLPADHGYALLGAIARHIPKIKEHNDIAILTAAGFGDREGKILLTEHSCFRIRVPVTKIPLVYVLAGKHLTLGIHDIQLGIPEIQTLRPRPYLRSRVVTIKGYQEPESFLEAAKRQLEVLGIQAELSIPCDRDGNPARKTIKIKRFTVIGFTVEAIHLSEEDSLKLQVYGLGGKRHMGCGVFIPVKERT